VPVRGFMPEDAGSTSSTVTSFDSASLVRMNSGLSGFAETPSYTSGERPSTVTATLNAPSSGGSPSTSAISTLIGLAFGEAFFAVNT